MTASYEFTDGLFASIRGGVNDIRTSFAIPETFENYDPAVEVDPYFRSNTFGENRVKTWIIEPGVNYNRTIGKGKLESLIGATFQQSDRNGSSTGTLGYASAAVINNPISGTINSGK